MIFCSTWIKAIEFSSSIVFLLHGGHIFSWMWVNFVWNDVFAFFLSFGAVLCCFCVTNTITSFFYWAIVMPYSGKLFEFIVIILVSFHCDYCFYVSFLDEWLFFSILVCAVKYQTWSFPRAKNVMRHGLMQLLLKLR